MAQFGDAPRFEIQADGTIIARAGTHLNCAGIAMIHVRIAATEDGFTFGSAFDPAWMGECDTGWVPGSAVIEAFREATFSGAREAFEQFKTVRGVSFELLRAWMHSVDSRTIMFKQAGFQTMQRWLERQGSTSVPNSLDG